MPSSDQTRAKLTALSRRYYELQAEFGEEAVILQAEGAFYAVLGDRATHLHSELGLKYCGGEDRGLLTRVGIHVNTIDEYKVRIAALGLLVVVVSQLENGAMKRSRDTDGTQSATRIRRFVESVDTLATLQGLRVAVACTVDTAPHPQTTSPNPSPSSREYAVTVLDLGSGEVNHAVHETEDAAFEMLLAADPYELVLQRANAELGARWRRSTGSTIPIRTLPPTPALSFLECRAAATPFFGAAGVASMDLAVFSAAALVDWMTVLKQEHWLTSAKEQASPTKKKTNQTKPPLLSRYPPLQMDLRTRQLLYNPSQSQSQSQSQVGASVGFGLHTQMDRCRTAAGSALLRQWLSTPLTDMDAIDGRQADLRFFRTHPGVVAELAAALGGPTTPPMAPLLQRLTKLTPPGLLENVVIPTAESIRRWVGFASQLAAALARCRRVCDTGCGDATGPELPQTHRLFQDLRRAQAEAAPCQALLEALVEAESGVSAPAFQPRAHHQQARASFVAAVAALNPPAALDAVTLRRSRGVVTVVVPAALWQQALPPTATLESQTATERRYVTDALRATAVRDAEAEMAALTARCKAVRGALVAAQQAVGPCRRCQAALAHLDLLSSEAQRPDVCTPIFGSTTSLRGVRMPDGLLFTTESRYYGSDLDWEGGRPVLLTGANGSGKSSLMRAVALNQVLAQCGLNCFASAFQTVLVDRIGLRFGASDTQEHSSFAREVQHADLLCRAATHRSMVFFDEFAQSTESNGGVRLCLGVLRWLASVGCRTLFATHFGQELRAHTHTLCTPLFTDTVGPHPFQLQPGIVPESAALRVAAAAGLPESILRRAAQLTRDAVSTHRK